MILKLDSLLYVYNHAKAHKTEVKHAPLSKEEKIKADRIVTLVMISMLLISSLLYTVL